jgi:hypothetical protein
MKLIIAGVDEANDHMSADYPTTIIMSLGSTAEESQAVSAGNPTKSVDKGKGKEADRGRTQERGPRYSNPLAMAESRPRKNDATIELDVQLIEKRQLSRSNTISNFDDANDPCAFLEDNLLEPCPRGSICNSVSEVLSASEISIGLPGRIFHGNTWSSFDNPRLNHPRPSRALTTIFSNCHPVQPAPTFHPEILPRVRPDIDQLENIAITSSTPLGSCSGASPSPRAAGISPSSSKASRLPTEIIQEILYNLAPAEFNAARHTCRSWFINSIHRSLLETMLRRAGFSNLIVPLTADQFIFEECSISAEWSMSKTLARECALGPDWTGNGLAREHTSETLSSAFVEVSTFSIFSSMALCQSLGQLIIALHCRWNLHIHTKNLY